MSPSPSKSPLVILDAGIIIEAFRSNSWVALLSRYSVVVSRTVMAEVMYYKTPVGQKIPIDLGPFEAAGTITVIDVAAGDLATFLAGFDPMYVERLHDGELESLCYLLQKADPSAQICSADSIVYKVLGKLRASHRGVSLEEMLAAISVSRRLEEKYSKGFRERYSSQGLSDSFGS